MVRIDNYSGNFNYLNSKDRSTIVRIYLPEDAPDLPDAGQEVLLDDFLLRRAQEGAVTLTEIKLCPDHEEP